VLRWLNVVRAGTRRQKKRQALFVGENRLRRWIGMGCQSPVWLAVSRLGQGQSRPSSLFFSVLFVGLALLVPTFSHVLATLLRAPMGLLFGTEGRLASDSLVSISAPHKCNPWRRSTFGLAFTLVMATFSGSIKASLTRWETL